MIQSPGFAFWRAACARSAVTMSGIERTCPTGGKDTLAQSSTTTAARKWECGSTKPGSSARFPSVTTRVPGPRSAITSAFAPAAAMRPLRTASASGAGWPSTMERMSPSV
jgi:hypothetical protein